MGSKILTTLLHSNPAEESKTEGSPETSWKVRADRSPLLRTFLLLSFFAVYIVLAVHSVSASEEHHWQKFAAYCTGQIVTLLVIFSSLRKRNAFSNKRIFVIWASVLAQLFIIQILAYFFMAELDSGPQLLLLTLPYIFAPMIATILLGRQMGVFTTYGVSFLTAPLMPPGLELPAITMSLIAGSVTVVATFRARSRIQLLRAGCITGFVVLIMGTLYGQIALPTVGDMDWLRLLRESLIAFSASLVLAIILTGLLPILEGTFAITTPTGWLERSDLNNKLLRRMQIEAPGTFHHSLMVAQLAEAAAEAIGANALECRVCAYYHDIGKLSRPDYFTENMPDLSHSPHDSLTPLMSAKILMKHVDDGVALARKNKLERHIIATIREHHGTSMVSFLYQKALIIRDEMMEKVAKGLANPEDVVYPEECQFRYAGPIPQSRETGIVSLADAIESASRSLKQPTVEDIQELVERIIRYRVNEGQLDDSRLTLGDLKIIKSVFISTIKSMLHSRISYPVEKEDKESTEAKEELLKEENESKSLLEKPSPTDQLAQISSEDEPSPEKKPAAEKKTDIVPTP